MQYKILSKSDEIVIREIYTEIKHMTISELALLFNTSRHNVYKTIKDITRPRLPKIPWNRGKHWNNETRKKIGNGNRGKIVSKEVRKRISESMKKYVRTEQHIINQSGINSGTYIDGRTPLIKRIRRSKQYKNWRYTIFERDDYTCQECGHRGGDLNVHHLKEFHKIFNEFLNDYDQLDLQNDSDELFLLSKKYYSFWEINNGITLCIDCHNETKKVR